MPNPLTSSGGARARAIRLLGDPAVTFADGGIKALERRAAGLLALVALEPGVTRARAAALLWPDSDNARQALRQQIARFRKVFGAELVSGEDALCLADGVTADLSTAAAGELLGALSFEDCPDFAAWLAQQRQRRRGSTVAEIGQLLAEAEAQGDWEAAVKLAEQLLAADNDSEAHHRTLMRLHYLRGDIAQAQAVYDRLARMLRTRFGARPSAETEQLARALRAAQPVAVPAASAPQRAVPVTVLRPPRMIGRQRELAALDQAWQGGRAALLLGEPGLGKTRLLSEFAAGRRVLTVQGRPGDAGVPYATLSRLLRTVIERSRIELPAPRRTELARLLPELAPSVPLPADGQRLLLQGAVEAVLAQARADGTATDGVIVDDLHFADEASVEMLQALVCGSGDGPLAGLRWALAQRPGEGSAAAAALRNALDEAQALAVIALAPLSIDEMAELIDSLGLPELDSAQLAPQLARHTGGNPLYALETLKQGLASDLLRQGRLPTPINVGALIERRLKQLSERALTLARVAAIAGVDFNIALAEHVIGVRAVELADAWAELEAAQVLREQAFAHDLVHDAVLRSVPEAIARHLHAQLAQWLVDHHGESARIAAHWEAARETKLAAEAWTEAARSADARLRYRESQACFERAARLFEVLGDRQSHFVALKGAVDQASLLDGHHASYAALCERLIVAAPDDGQRVQAMVYRLRALELAGDSAALLRGADEVVALAQTFGQKYAEAVGRSARATAFAALGRMEEAAALYREVAELGAAIADPEIEGFGLASRATMLVRLGRHSEALLELEHARVLYAKHDFHLRLVVVEQQMAVIFASRGYAADGLAAAERALSLAGRIEIATDILGHCHLARAMALRALGRYAEALDALEAIKPVLEAAQTWVLARVQLELAHIFQELGRPDRARFLLASVRDGNQLPVGERPRLAALDLLLKASAVDPVAVGDAALALAVANDASVEPRRRCELLRALAQSAHGAERQSRLEQALRLAAESDLPHEHSTARALLARDLARTGQPGAAAELMRMAVADDAIVPAGYPLAVLECAIEVWYAAGDGERAGRTLRRALDWIYAASRGLPDGLRSSFVERNPVNRRLIELGRRTFATSK